MTVTLRHDVLTDVTVYNNFAGFRPYPSPPTGYLSMNYTRSQVKDALGAPASCSVDQSVCFYNYYAADITVTYSNKNSCQSASDNDSIMSIHFSKKK